MAGLLVLAIIVALVAVVGALAQEFGADSRPGVCESRMPACDVSI
jgi:hypothetical protein